MKEVWKELIDYPGYAVSNLGNVMNTNTDLLKKPSINQQGISMVNFSLKSQQHVRSVALLVSDNFLSPPKQLHFDTPIHLDGDRRNCRVDNLVWRPRWFAVMYHRQFSEWERANRFGLRSPVELLDTEEIFPTSWEAAIKYGLLDHEIFLSIVNRTYVFPHNYMFRELTEQEADIYTRENRGI